MFDKVPNTPQFLNPFNSSEIITDFLIVRPSIYQFSNFQFFSELSPECSSDFEFSKGLIAVKSFKIV